jgi:hypothetical protein
MLYLVFLQVTSVTTGRTAKQKDKIFVAAGNMVSSSRNQAQQQYEPQAACS